MKHQGLICIAAGLFFQAILGVVSAQTPSGPQWPVVNTPATNTIEAKGTVEYMEALGGYFFMSEDPPGEFFIVNPNRKELEKLYQEKKTLKIQGHLTIGADHLFIDKIDGRRYAGQ